MEQETVHWWSTEKLTAKQEEVVTMEKQTGQILEQELPEQQKEQVLASKVDWNRVNQSQETKFPAKHTLEWCMKKNSKPDDAERMSKQKLPAQHHDEENLKQQIKQGTFELKLQEYQKQQTLTQEKNVNVKKHQKETEFPNKYPGQELQERWLREESRKLQQEAEVSKQNNQTKLFIHSKIKISVSKSEAAEQGAHKSTNLPLDSDNKNLYKKSTENFDDDKCFSKQSTKYVAQDKQIEDRSNSLNNFSRGELLKIDKIDRNHFKDIPNVTCSSKDNESDSNYSVLNIGVNNVNNLLSDNNQRPDEKSIKILEPNGRTKRRMVPITKEIGKISRVSDSTLQSSRVESGNEATDEEENSPPDTDTPVIISACSCKSAACLGPRRHSKLEKHLSHESTKEQLIAVNLAEDESRASSVDNTIKKLVDDVVVVVTNLPSSVSSEILYKWFKLKCQGVKEASLKNKPGCGEVKFKSKIEMEKCVKRMDKTFWFGQKIHVRPKTSKKEREVEKKLPQHLHCKLQNELQQQDQNQQQQQPQQTQQDRQPQHRIPPKRDTLQDETSPMQNEEYSSTVSFSPNDKTCNIFAVNSEPTSVKGGPSITDSFLEAIKISPSDSKDSEKCKVNSIKVLKNEIRENEHIEQNVCDYGSFAEEIKVEHKDFTCSSEAIPLAACVNDSGGRSNSVTFNPEMRERVKINDESRQSKENSIEDQGYTTCELAHGQSVTSDVSKTQKNVFTVSVNNLPHFVSDKKLYNCFNNKCQGVKKAYRTKRHGCGEVIFQSKEEMEMCVKKMDNTYQFGGGNGRIHVRAKESERKQDKSKQQGQHGKEQKKHQQHRQGPSRSRVKENKSSFSANGKNSLQSDSFFPEMFYGEFISLEDRSSACEDKTTASHSSWNSETPLFDKSHLKKPVTQDNMSVNVEKDESLFAYSNAANVEKASNPGEVTSTGDGSNDLNSQSKTVVVRSIPKNVTKGCFRQFIESKNCGGILKLSKSKNRPFAVITFETKTHAERALKLFDGLHWKGETLNAKIRLSKPASEDKQIESELKERLCDKFYSESFTVKLHNVSPLTTCAELEGFIREQCEAVVISKLVKAEKVYIVELKTEDDCSMVCQTISGKTLHGRKIITTWANKSDNKGVREEPYIVISNLNPQFQEKAVKETFDVRCQGVTRVQKHPNMRFARIYFDSADLATKAAQLMDEFVMDHRKLKVTLGIDALRETQKVWYGQLEKYIDDLENRSAELLHNNTCKLNDLEKSFEELHRTRPRKASLEQFEQYEEARKTCKQKQKELKDQREEFLSKYKQLTDLLLVEAKEHLRVDGEKSAKKVIAKHKKAITREFKRFEASLPIYAKRREIIEVLCKNQALVLKGETGSGKSTQLAQYLADDLFSKPNSIVVTQPRKVAAVTLARQVAKEYGCSVGEEVGYHVGFGQKTSRKTIMKFVTDRILLNEILKERNSIEQYSCIIVDEAHERSIHTDLLLATIKQIMQNHPNLRLILTSATINTDIFQRYYDFCPVVNVQGRTFPVERVYVKERPSDYVDSVYEKAVEVCESGEQGDILIFLTQQNEIEKTCERLEKRFGDDSVILPLHGKLQAEDQEMVFKPTPQGKRKVVVATNIAETSVTIDGIRFVIDSGMVKEPSIDPIRNMTILDVNMISRSSALQRSGRAGRTAPGKCYCMYTSEDFNDMKRDPEPEILKMHLGMAVLQLLSLGVRNIEQFDFIEAPPRQVVVKAEESLKQLGALDQNGTLTGLGKKMVELPTDPKISKALLEGLRRGCGEEIITVAALMAGGRDVFYHGDTAEKRDRCAIQKQEFCTTSGDLLSALQVYKLWSNKPEKKQSQWCMENALNAKSLRLTRETIREIKYALTKLQIIKSPSKLEATSLNLELDLRKSLLAGYSENIAWSKGHEKVGYTVAQSNQNARIHPSSVLSSLSCQPHWILFQEMRRTSETFLCNVTRIEKEWLAEVAMHMMPFVDEDKIRRWQAVRERIQSRGPALVKSLIGLQGSTLRQIEHSLFEYAGEHIQEPRVAGISQSPAFCSIDCNVEEGFVDIYASAECIEDAKYKVKEVIDNKRRDLLDGGREIIISNVGSLKALIGNDMKTRAILQPGEFCKLDVFLEKEDVNCDVDPVEVLWALKDAGNVVHFNVTSTQKSHCNRWGTVTYSSPEEAKEAKQVVEDGFDATDLPNNVLSIQLNPCHTEPVQPQKSISITGTRVVVTWYPYPSTCKAYVRCCNDEATKELCCKLNDTVMPRSLEKYKASVNEKTGDIKLAISNFDDERTVTEMISACGYQCDPSSISKITVPSYRGGKFVRMEEEKRKLFELVKKFGQIHVVDVRSDKSEKLIANVVFVGFEDAMKAIKELNGKIGELGERAVYLDADDISEINCNKRLYSKIKTAVKKVAEREEVDLNEIKNGREIKIKVTGNRGEIVQMVGAQIADIVSVKSATIEDLAVARRLSSSYGRSKLKTIQRESGALIWSNMIDGCIQITGSPEAKEQAFRQVKELVSQMMENTVTEISLKGPNIPTGTIREMLMQFGRDLKGLVENGEECQVEMDIRRRKLILRGSKDVENVRERVDQFLNQLRLPHQRRIVNEVKEVCPVCIDKVDEPYHLNVCGHCYCSACMNQYITSPFDSVKSASMFPLKCLYDNCHYPLTMEDFQAFLKKDQIEQLNRISFESFVIGSDKYKSCSSPDCSWVYKSTSRPKVFVCPECKTRVCRSCGNLPHELYDTCEAYRMTKDPSKADELYEKWVSQANTRKCPKCSVMIEKNQGCSHVHCTLCEAHICWKCGKYFKSRGQCYDHINDCKR